MDGTPHRHGRGPCTAVLLVLLGVLLLATTAACTGGSEREPTAEPGEAASSRAAAPASPSVPMRVQVTHVSGALNGARRAALAVQVRRTIAAYVDAAFLAGDYPRSGFAGAFAAFTPGAARQARTDQALLTNQPLGASTRSVRATRRTAYLSVLSPRQHPVGVTAAVDLVFAVDRGEAAAQRVEVRGRLLLTPSKTGTWKIFGYDVTRSQSARAGRS